MSAPIGERVRFWRRRRGMSQRILADFAGISESYVKQIESGKKAVERRSTVVRLAHVLRVSPAELTGEQREEEGEAGPVTGVRDVEVVLAADAEGHRPEVLVMDSRTRRPLLRLTPEGAASLCTLMSAIVATARRRW